MWGAIFGILAGIFIASLAWDAINNWIARSRTPNSELAELVKSRLANGKVKVVGGIFDKHGRRESTETWEVESLDEDMQRRFGNGNRAVIRLN